MDTEKVTKDEKKLKEKGWLPRYYEENLRHRTLQRIAFGFGDEQGEAEALVEGMAVWGVDVGPNGRYVAFGASAENLVDQRYMFQDIHVLDLESGEHRLVVDVPGKLGQYRLSPDGSRLAWTGAASRSDHSTSSLFISGLDGSGQANITPLGFAGHIRTVHWWNDHTVLYLASAGLYATLSMKDIDRKTGERTVIFSGAEHDLVVGMPAIPRDDRPMVMVGHNATTPRELYAWSGRSD